VAGKVIGIDMGGTFIKAGVVDEDGKILARVEIPTEATRGRAAVIANIAKAVDEARKAGGLGWRSVRAVGLAAPGVFPEGRVFHCPYITCLEGKQLAGPVAKKLGIAADKVILENDANAAAYAESWIGCGREVDSLVLFTLGTGVGGGIILDNKIWRGHMGFAGELGHQIVDPNGALCGCGAYGCIEAYASATGIVRRFKALIASGRKSKLAKAVKAGDEVTARDICMAAKAGDKASADIMEETGKLLGAISTNMLNILNVERVVFAGGVTKAGSILLKPIRDDVKARLIPVMRKGVKILFSKLGNDAGLIGAAGWAYKMTEKPSRRGRK